LRGNSHEVRSDDSRSRKDGSDAMSNDTRVDGNGFQLPYAYYAPPQDTDNTSPGVYGPFVPQTTAAEIDSRTAALPYCVGTTQWSGGDVAARPAFTADTAAPSETGVSQADVNALKLDLAQMGIDLVGIADPTPISDGSNAIISLFRGHWKDAAISAVAIVPYVGDAAKLAKVPKYLKMFEQLAEVAAAVKGPVRNMLLAAAEKVSGLVHRIGDALGAAGAKLKQVIDSAIQKLIGPKEPPPSLGPAFNPNVRGLQEGVDPRTVPKGSQDYLWSGQRLTPGQMERVRNVERFGMNNPIETRMGRLEQGNHRLYIALGYNGRHPDRMHPVDVYNHG
ncbi:MAG TPA: hypothetical protein VIT67_16730, partial [Povalibacter sp.]